MTREDQLRNAARKMYDMLEDFMCRCVRHACKEHDNAAKVANKLLPCIDKEAEK